LDFPRVRHARRPRTNPRNGQRDAGHDATTWPRPSGRRHVVAAVGEVRGPTDGATSRGRLRLPTAQQQSPAEFAPLTAARCDSRERGASTDEPCVCLGVRRPPRTYRFAPRSADATQNRRSARLPARGSVYRGTGRFIGNLVRGPAIQRKLRGRRASSRGQLGTLAATSRRRWDMRAAKSGRRAGWERHERRYPVTRIQRGLAGRSPRRPPETHSDQACSRDAHETFVSNGPRDHIRAPAPKRWSPYVCWPSL